jgi:hypothetical protein
MIDLFGDIPEDDELSFTIIDIPLLIDQKGKYSGGEYSSIPIESIDYKVETHANLSRVEELINDTVESEDSLSTDELIYHAYKSTTSNYRDEDQPPLFLALSGSEKEQWETAIREKQRCYLRTDTLIPVVEEDRKSLPSNCKIIHSSIYN